MFCVSLLLPYAVPMTRSFLRSELLGRPQASERGSAVTQDPAQAGPPSKLLYPLLCREPYIRSRHHIEQQSKSSHLHILQ